MFIVTNRNIVMRGEGVEKLGPRLNDRGPAELRLVEAIKKNGKWVVNVLPDKLAPALKTEVGIKEKGEVYASEYVFRRLLSIINPPAAAAGGKDLLLFVHGFNNDFQDVLERCQGLADTFNLEVVAFTWPANGGGVKGVTDYLEDKRDAQASVVAFDRVLARAREMITVARGEYLARLTKEAQEKFPASGERQREYVARLADEQCPFRISMLLHSMGNYLFERTLKSTALRGSQLIFDNIVMAAADVNNPGHAEWVNQIQVRKRLYITINEDDHALQAARVKGGDEQMARLGHYTYNLEAQQAVYVDFTGAKSVGNSHAYFEGAPLKNVKARNFFDLALRGQSAERLLAYDVSRNLHRLA